MTHVRGNKTIRFGDDGSVHTQQGGASQFYPDPASARQSNPDCRRAFRDVICGTGRLSRGNVQNPVELQLTPECELFSCDVTLGKAPARLNVFSAGKKPFAVQLFGDQEGVHRDIYCKDPSICERAARALKEFQNGIKNRKS